MKPNDYANISEVKKLLEMAAKNNVKVEFLDSENPDHLAMRRQLVHRNYAMIYNDMDLAQMKRALKNTLRDNGIEPNQENYDLLKVYYQEIKSKTDKTMG